MKGRRWGDRRDGTLIRDIDAMHFIMPIIYPGRCDNEAFISETVDLTNMDAYLEKKNAADPEYKYSLFIAIITAMLKTVTLRPKMNRFIANDNIYQRNEVSAAFVIKKSFEDDGEEGLAFYHSKETDTIESVYQDIYQQISRARNNKEKDQSSESMDIFNKMPRFLSKFLIHIIMFLDRHGWVPKSLIETDPYYSSVLLTNLGSIKLHSGYHHLTNWGTNSVFVIVGERKPRKFFDENGDSVVHDSIDIAFTIDERIADGYYYSKTMRLFRKLMTCPELLDRPLNEKFEF